jgi:hypothetical protein
MSDGGKGSAPRPFSVSRDQYSNNYDTIFRSKKVENNTGTDKNEYYDILSTEEALHRASVAENDRLDLYKKAKTPR